MENMFTFVQKIFEIYTVFYVHLHYTCWPCVYLLLTHVYSGPLPIFNQFFYWVVRVILDVRPSSYLSPSSQCILEVRPLSGSCVCVCVGSQCISEVRPSTDVGKYPLPLCICSCLPGYAEACSCLTWFLNNSLTIYKVKLRHFHQVNTQHCYVLEISVDQWSLLQERLYQHKSHDSSLLSFLLWKWDDHQGPSSCNQTAASAIYWGCLGAPWTYLQGRC